MAALLSGGGAEVAPEAEVGATISKKGGAARAGRRRM